MPVSTLPLAMAPLRPGPVTVRSAASRAVTMLACVACRLGEPNLVAFTALRSSSTAVSCAAAGTAGNALPSSTTAASTAAVSGAGPNSCASATRPGV